MELPIKFANKSNGIKEKREKPLIEISFADKHQDYM